MAEPQTTGEQTECPHPAAAGRSGPAKSSAALPWQFCQERRAPGWSRALSDGPTLRVTRDKEDKARVGNLSRLGEIKELTILVCAPDGILGQRGKRRLLGQLNEVCGLDSIGSKSLRGALNGG